jgi:hypothetical protein
MKAKINWQEVLPKSSVQDKFTVDKNKLWRSYFWDNLKRQLGNVVLIIIVFELFYVPRDIMDRTFMGIGLLIGICLGFIVWFVDFYTEANRVVESYFFDITDNFIIIVARNVSFVAPVRAVYKVSVEHQFFARAYRVKIQSQFSRKPLYIMGFDEKTAHELKDYIAAKMPNLEN